MYAVEFFLDENIESYVRNIWSELKTIGITSYMADIEELRPHVTVAVYHSELPFEKFIRQFDIVTKTMSQIDVKFDIVSTFPTSGVVFCSGPRSQDTFFENLSYSSSLCFGIFAA